MQGRRAVVLMGVFLCLLGGYIYVNLFGGDTHISKVVDNTSQPKLIGEIASAALVSQTPSEAIIKVAYKIEAMPVPANLLLNVPVEKNSMSSFASGMQPVQLGEASMDIKFKNPNFYEDNEYTSEKLTVSIMQAGGYQIQRTFDFKITWAGAKKSRWYSKIHNTSADDLYKEAVFLIDTGSDENIQVASEYLNSIVSNDPKYATAYLELARIAMKTNWNQEGLYQAEQLIKTTMVLDPDSANARVLLGYVYVHQKKYSEAEKLFIEAEKIGTKNLWLWANWGQLLYYQNKKKESIEKYLAAVQGARPNDTYDRARMDAYRNLFKLIPAGSFQQLNDLYAKREQEFDDCSCCRLEHAKFLFNYDEGVSKAIPLINEAKEIGCGDKNTRSALGIAYYLQTKGNFKDMDALSKARAFYPEGAALFYELVGYKSGVAVLKSLIAEGSNIDIKDRDDRTALSIAIINDDMPEAKELLKLGANPYEVIGVEKFPLSLLPVVNRNQGMINVLKNHGVDYNKVQYMGRSGVEFSQEFPGIDVGQSKGKDI